MYCEEELVQTREMVFGQWKYNLSDEEVKNKLQSLCNVETSSTYKDNGNWTKLFSMYQEASDDKTSLLLVNEVEPMEISSSTNILDDNVVTTDGDHSSVEDLALCLADKCNQSGPKLRLGLQCIQEDLEVLMSDLKSLNEESLVLLIKHAWSQLNSDASRACFCLPFMSNSRLCEKLCQYALHPWMCKSSPSKMEQLSSILSAEGDTVSRHLVAPLLRMEESSLVQDLISLEELMTSMTEKNWTTVLVESLSGLVELEKWHVPVLASVVEHAGPSVDELRHLVQMMASAGTAVVQSRDFGVLLVNVAQKSLQLDIDQLKNQLKLIANNYKGTLKFKALKILSNAQE